jgi:hypothetical protein
MMSWARRCSPVLVVALACALVALATLCPGTAVAGAAVQCGSTFPQCNGTCPANEACVGLGGGACVCYPTGCCQVDANTCENNAFEALCPGQFVAAGTCGVDCKNPDGGSCSDPADCVSGNCVDDTCCADASCPQGQSCNNPGSVGVCSADLAAAAPAISPGGAIVAVSLLIAVAAIALLRRRRAGV